MNRRKANGVLRLIANAVHVDAFAVAVLCIAMGAPVSAFARAIPKASSTSRAGTTVARPWQFERKLGAKTVEISLSWTDCGRRPAPTRRAKVVERPGRAIITALVHTPASSPGTPCKRVRKKGKIRVRLDRPISSLKLYDGSFTPPKLRWPESGG